IVLTGMIGRQISQTGFALLQPVSVIQEEIVKDPRSPIAVGHAIAAKNGTEPGRAGALQPLVVLLPSLAIVAVDARRRAVLATVAYALTIFVTMGVRLASQPAFAALVPGAGITVLAALVTVAIAVVSGLAIRRITDKLAAATAQA